MNTVTSAVALATPWLTAAAYPAFTSSGRWIPA